MNNQREIKFRVWSKNEERMIPWEKIENGSENTLKENFDAMEKIGFILMQFTGLKDKKGVEIFEGDIVEFETLDSINNKKLKGNVYYETIGFKVMVKDLGCKEFYGDYTEVIGDIYSNPELKVAEDN